MTIYIGCAGWSLPKHLEFCFPVAGTHLARYGTRFSAVEINSSFYRPHRSQTYQRWATSTPENFRFSVKTPKQITHESRLIDCAESIECFVEQVQHLGDKLGPLLVQLPPSLQFHATTAEQFFHHFRRHIEVPIVCEPRHSSWFTEEADKMLRALRIARVAADPAPVPIAAQPGGWPGLTYYRLHGSPRMYYSSYDETRLLEIMRRLVESSHRGATTWCIFDNTALGAAFENALDLVERVDSSIRSRKHGVDGEYIPST